MVAIAVLTVLLVVSLVCNGVLLVWVFKQKLSNEQKPKLVYVVVIMSYCCHFYVSSTKHAPEPAYELVDKSGGVKLEDNPAYSVTVGQDSSEDNQYDVIPGGHHAKAK